MTQPINTPNSEGIWERRFGDSNTQVFMVLMEGGRLVMRNNQFECLASMADKTSEWVKLFDLPSQPIILKKNNTPKRPGNYLTARSTVHECEVVYAYKGESGMVFRVGDTEYAVDEYDFWSNKMDIEFEFEGDEPAEDHIPDTTKKVEESEVQEASEPQRLRQGWFEWNRERYDAMESRDGNYVVITPPLDKATCYSLSSLKNWRVKIHWHDEPSKPEKPPREIKPGQRWRNKGTDTEYIVFDMPHAERGNTPWGLLCLPNYHVCFIDGRNMVQKDQLQAWLNENAEPVPEETA